MTDVALDLEVLGFCADAYNRTDPDFAGADCRAFVYPSSIGPVLVFAGSRTAEDWITDVELGFGKDAQAIVDAVLAKYPSGLVLAGHSKGGAEAQKMAELFDERGIGPLPLTTYGAPRTGNCGGRLLRWPRPDWCHTGDHVPGVPPLEPHPRQVTWIGTALPENLDLFTNHHLTAYRAALQALATA